MEQCPCGSGQPYADCCGRFHIGAELPATPEALMRSRYTAYVLKRSSYLHATWHPTTRPATLDISSDETVWQGLEILGCGEGREQNGQGWVEFVVWFQGGELHEKSRFVKEEGEWFYLDGKIEPPLAAIKPGRNASCPCGSGKKYKKCCGR
jgi:SEC-C motif domain protein